MDKRKGETLKSKCPENEFDLWELFQIIWRYKWFIIVLFALAVGTSILVSKVMTPVYKVTASIFNTRPGIVSTNELAVLFKELFKEKAKMGGENYPLKHPEIRYNSRTGENLITLAFHSTQPEMAIKILKKEVKKTFEYERDIIFRVKYKYKLKAISEKMKTGITEMRIIEKELAKGNKRLSTLEGRYNILKQRESQLQKATRQGMLPGLILMQNEISTLRQDLYKQNLDLADKKTALNLLKLEKEKILNQDKEAFVWGVPPHTSKKPVRPWPLLYTATAAGVLALFIGVLLAFFIEFVRKNRAKSVSA